MLSLWIGDEDGPIGSIVAVLDYCHDCGNVLVACRCRRASRYILAVLDDAHPDYILGKRMGGERALSREEVFLVDDDLADEVVSKFNDFCHEIARSQAAEAWSTAGDDLEDQALKSGYSEVHVLATFGDWEAHDGDLCSGPDWFHQGSAHTCPNWGLMDILPQGGDIPSTEEEVGVSWPIEHTAKELRISEDEVRIILAVKDELRPFQDYVYVSVSGDSTVYGFPSLGP